MELTIKKTLLQGVTAHKEGNLQDAERLYKFVLQSQLAHPHGSHNFLYVGDKIVVSPEL
jgi:hypothetical protein